MFRNRKAQSSLEYIAVFTAVALAVVAYVQISMKKGVKAMMERSETQITASADAFTIPTAP